MERTTRTNKPLAGIFLLLPMVLMVLMCLSPAVADNGTPEKNSPLRFNLKGQATSLWVFMSGDNPKQDYTLNQNRLRLEQDTFFQEKLHLKLIWDLEGFTGNYTDTTMWKHGWNPQQDSFWNLTGGKSPGKGLFLRHSLHRAYLTHDSSFARFYAGKQRIAWGVMRYWRPTDIFNSESPLQIEAGERTGIDALRITAPLSGADGEFVYAPSRNPGGQTTAGKFHFTVGDYDISFIGGTLQRNQLAGFTFDGYVGDGGFRGEMLRIRPYDGNPYYIWAIGGDYTFPGPLTVTGEYLSNGGAGTGSAVNPLLPGSGILQTLGRSFLSLGVDYQFTPLITGSLFTSHDFDGSTTAISPRANWNYKKNVDLSAGAVIPLGSEGGEYSRSPRTVFFQMKRYF